MRPSIPLLVLALCLASGCATFAIDADDCPAYPAVAPKVEPEPGHVKIQYLGSGGYLVRRGDDVVLFGPQYSNPGITEVGFNHTIRTDRALVDTLLPKDADLAQAIVVGHAHYDHLMDTPYIATEHARNATVYGSATMKNLIGSAVPASRLFDVGPAATPPPPGTERKPIVINPRMRLWPIRSQHSDQTRVKIWPLGLDLPLHMWRGEVLTPQSTLPTTASEWAEGEVYAYVLDFMDPTGKNVEFRVYYQDSGTDEPIGYPWDGGAPPDNKGIDAAHICVGGDFENLRNHPGGIITKTRPRFLLLGHWENFFEPQTDICRTDRVDAIPRFDVKAFMGDAKEAMSKAGLRGQPILACPTASVFHIPMDASGDAAIYRALKSQHTTYRCWR